MLNNKRKCVNHEITQINHHNLQIHIHGTATPISGQHFRGTLCDINPETMEFFVRETDNPEDGDKKTLGPSSWSLGGSTLH